jgi:glutamate carboxypeptidase
LTSVGRAAHAGTEPDAGINAVAVLAPEVMRIHDLHHARPGMTAQVTSFNGGVGINTVPARAELVADIRAVSEVDLDWASRQLDPRPGEDGITRSDLARTPAMERTPRVQAMASAARRIGSALGQSFGEASTGGTSDAAWAAALGIPTIDGLGPVGGLDHTRDEYAEIATFVPRCGVTAGLVGAINDGLLNVERARR